MRFSHYMAIQKFINSPERKKFNRNSTLHILQAQAEFLLYRNYEILEHEVFCVNTYSVSILSNVEAPVTHLAAYRYDEQTKSFKEV